MDNRSPWCCAEASRLHVCCDARRASRIKQAAFTDFNLEARRNHAHVVENAQLSPTKSRRRRDGFRQAAPLKHEAGLSSRTEHHNPIEMHATTVSGTATAKYVYDKTQGAQNVQRYLCGGVRFSARHVRVMTPYVGGAFGSGLAPAI